MTEFRLFLVYCIMCTRYSMAGVTYAQFCEDKKLQELTLQFMINEIRSEMKAL